MANSRKKLRILTTALCISCVIASGVDFLDAPIKVTKGDNLNIECVSLLPTQWVYNNGVSNQTLQEKGNPRVHRVSNTSLHLMIANADYRHNGQYVCQEVRNDTDKTVYMQLKVVVTNRPSPYCTDKMFECAGKCIARRFLCDRYVDCVDGSDEQHCPLQCDSDIHFECDNGQCINGSLRCDKLRAEDCRDGSDEKGCPDRIYKYTGQVQAPDENDPSQTMLYKNQGWHSHGIYGIVVAVMGLIFTITVIVVTICRIHMRRDAQMAMIASGRVRTQTLSSNSESREETYHPSTSGAVFVEPGPVTVPGEMKGLIVSPPPYSTLDRADTPPPPYDNIDDPLYRPPDASDQDNSSSSHESSTDALLRVQPPPPSSPVPSDLGQRSESERLRLDQEDNGVVQIGPL